MKSKLMFSLIFVFVLPAVVIALPASIFEGMPGGMKSGSEDVAYVWHKQDGFHVRFTSKIGHNNNYTGKVCVQKNIITKLTPNTVESEDSTALNPQKKCVMFNLKNHGGFDGFDFDTMDKTIIFDFAKNGTKLKPADVRIGAQSKKPTKVPFVARR